MIPRNVRLGEAPSYGLPGDRSTTRQLARSRAYLKLAKEVAARG